MPDATTATGPDATSAPTPGTDKIWRALTENPQRWVASPTLDAALGGDSDRVAALLAQPRFRERIWQRLQREHRLPSLAAIEPPAATDIRVIDAAGVSTQALIVACGVLAHANTLIGEIRSARIARLREHIDEALWQHALRHADAATEPLADTADVDALMTRIETCGVAILKAWMATQPEPLQAWLAIGMGMEMEQHAALGPAPASAGEAGAPADPTETRWRERGPTIARLAAELAPRQETADG